MDEIARLTPTFAGVSYREARRARLRAVALQRRRRRRARRSCMSTGFVRGKGRFMITDFVPTDERTRPRVPAAAHHRPHLSASTTSARRPAAPPISVWHEEDVLEIHPSDAESRGIRERRSAWR
jgi:formate dehydrogenase major subunit